MLVNNSQTNAYELTEDGFNSLEIPPGREAVVPRVKRGMRLRLVGERLEGRPIMSFKALLGRRRSLNEPG